MRSRDTSPIPEPTSKTWSARTADGKEFCSACQCCEVFRNQHPHGVELGYADVLLCIPCFVKRRKAREKDAKKAFAAQEEYRDFLVESKAAQLELF